MSTIKPSKEETKEYCMRKLRSRFKIFQVVKGLPGTCNYDFIGRIPCTWGWCYEYDTGHTPSELCQPNSYVLLF